MKCYRCAERKREFDTIRELNEHIVEDHKCLPEPPDRFLRFTK